MEEKNVSRTSFVCSGILIVLSVVSLVMLGYFEYILFYNHVLPTSYRIGIGVVLALFIVICFALALGPRRLLFKVLGILLSAGLIFSLFVGIMYLTIGLNTLQSIQTTNSNKPVATKNQSTPDPVNVMREGFIVYVSGIDEYGSISDVSRSDVNILLAVDPKNHNICMLSVPRDSYLRIAGGGKHRKDKLTHAGIYGISSSVQTIEEALGININYFVRLNFTSFLKIIDQVGGIEVDNPHDFTLGNGVHYQKGKITLNGAEALDFVRERYHLPNGDFDRQKNQQLVIESVFHKVLSPQLILSFNGIMQSISDSVQTNASQKVILDFVNSQMDVESNWKFATIYLDGENKMGLPSYAMPNARLFFFVPKESSLRKNGKILNRVVSGNYEQDLEELVSESSFEEEEGEERKDSRRSTSEDEESPDSQEESQSLGY